MLSNQAAYELLTLNNPSHFGIPYRVGINKVEWYWWGFKLYLDSTNAGKVASGISIAAGISALIPDPTVSKVVAIALTVSAGLVGYANSSGRGIVARFNYVPFNPYLVLSGVSSQ